MTEHEEQLIRDAFKAGFELGKYDDSLKEDEYIEALKAKPGEENITLTYQQIRLSCGWSDFCDVTGHNHWAVLREIDDSYMFTVTISQYKQLNLKIK